MEQIDLPFGMRPEDYDNKALWTPRDIWTRLDQRLLEYFLEDRRVERKGNKRINFDDLASYESTFSNTPDGGLIVYGVENDGEITGCNALDVKTLNEIESCHVRRCPQARPEFKRIPVIIENKQDFCLAVYIPYIGRLVETNKDEAWIRYGEEKHRMSDEEKRDFRSTRQELSFELHSAPYVFPRDFDLRVVQDFCDAFRTRENNANWSNEDVLIDRHLVKRENGQIIPLNNLVLLAALDPRITIPGCRVRIQRFGTIVEGAGSEYSPLQDKFVEGNLVKIIGGATDILDSWVYDVTWLTPEGKFVTTPEYPKWAWLESLVNACVHRSYSFSGSDITVKLFPDRMEIESPGGFVPPVNEKTIYHTRAARNLHLMDALRYLGYVQMAREGTRRIRESMQEMHLPDPVFRQEALHGVVVRVTLKNDHETRKRATDRDVATHFGVALWKTLAEHEIKIAAYAFRNSSIQVSEAQRLTGRTWATSKKDLDRLVAKGILVFEPGKYARDSKATYRIVPREGEREDEQQ